MQRFILLMIVLLGLVTLWAGCSRSAEELKPKPPPHEEKAVSAGVTDIAKVIDIPEWFLNPPEDPNYLYATGTHKGPDLGFAREAATQAGRLEIANQIQTRIMGLFKRFHEEVGTGEDAEFTAITTAISKAVVSETLNLSRPAKQDVKMEESVHYRVYVLMEMPIGLANTALMKEIKANRNMYTQFRASQAFKELEAEVEKYGQSKKEQSQ